MKVVTCKNCEKEFSTNEDSELAKKTELPSPILCQECTKNTEQGVVLVLTVPRKLVPTPISDELKPDIYEDNTVVININGVSRKIFKITPHADGGFNVHVPYHKEKSGYLYTVKIPYYQEDYFIDLKKAVVKEFTSDTDIKMSIHRSGFVQFSKGPDVISGIDQATGETKGLGIKIGPLDNPIQTGPTFGVTVWGLDHFDTLTKKQKGKNYIEFEESDFIYNHCTKDDFNAYHIGAWIFPNMLQNNICKLNDKLLLTRRFKHYTPDPKQIFNLKIILIKNCPSFIALYCERIKVSKEFGETGYNIEGPSQILDEKINDCMVGEHIKAAYPRPKFFTENKEIKSIHRKVN